MRARCQLVLQSGVVRFLCVCVCVCVCGHRTGSDSAHFGGRGAVGHLIHILQRWPLYARQPHTRNCRTLRRARGWVAPEHVVEHCHNITKVEGVKWWPVQQLSRVRGLTQETSCTRVCREAARTYTLPPTCIPVRAHVHRMCMYTFLEPHQNADRPQAALGRRSRRRPQGRCVLRPAPRPVPRSQ